MKKNQLKNLKLILLIINQKAQKLLEQYKLIFEKMQSNVIYPYRYNKSDRILQGDIFTDVEIPIVNNKQLKFIKSPYLIVLTQDCDLNQDFNSRTDIQKINFDESEKEPSSFNNRMIPSILLCPAYPADKLREGNHLEILDIEMSRIKKKSSDWKRITQNETPRYHYLKKYEKIGLPDLVLDFKRYYTLSQEYLYSIRENTYHISLNELYREDLSTRFCNYLSRIGLP